MHLLSWLLFFTLLPKPQLRYEVWLSFGDTAWPPLARQEFVSACQAVSATPRAALGMGSRLRKAELTTSGTFLALHRATPVCSSAPLLHRRWSPGRVVCWVWAHTGQAHRCQPSLCLAHGIGKDQACSPTLGTAGWDNKWSETSRAQRMEREGAAEVMPGQKGSLPHTDLSGEERDAWGHRIL